MAVTLTQRDVELLLAAISSTKTEFAIDYDKFAKAANLKNKHTAQVIWTGVKKKLNAMRDGGASAASPSSSGPGTPKSAKAKKRKQSHEIGGDVDDDEDMTPSASKKGKRSQKSASPAKDEEGSLETEDGAGGVKPEPED